MNPLTVWCSTCFAEIDQPCDWKGWNYAQPHPDFHAARIADAADQGDQPLPKEIVDKVGEEYA